MNSGRSLRRLWRSPYVLVAAVVFFLAGSVVVGSTLASFSAETDNGNSALANGWVGPATNLAESPSGFDADLTWAYGTHGSVTGQQLDWVDNQTSSTCPTSTSSYALLATMTGPTTTSYPATNTGTGQTTTTTNLIGVTTLKTALPAATTITTVGGINATATTFTVGSNSGMTANQTTIQVDNEDMLITNVTGTTLTVTRHTQGTTAASHAQGATVTVVTVIPTAFATFPTSNGYTIQIESEDMQVIAGAGTGTWVVTRGTQSTTAVAHAVNLALNQVSVPVTSATGFPSNNGYDILIGTEQMTVVSGAGTTTWIVTRGANQTTIASHASGVTVTEELNGHHYCYLMLSTTSSTWTGKAVFPVSQIGLIATSVVITNATSGHLNTGDKIVVTYNQQPTITATGLTNGVCESWDASGHVTLYIAYSTCNSPPTSPGYELAITGLTNGAVSANKTNANATVTVSSSAPWTVTYTLSANLTQAMNAGTGTASPDPTGTHVKSTNGGVDAAAACANSTYNCDPSATLH
ncbi:MAG TPA: hypothetical protein VKR79_06130 [Gaiellaceae bacterium]|nr:hypothetical protein [Gaiellaceae bacterium]